MVWYIACSGLRQLMVRGLAASSKIRPHPVKRIEVLDKVVVLSVLRKCKMTELEDAEYAVLPSQHVKKISMALFAHQPLRTTDYIILDIGH